MKLLRLLRQRKIQIILVVMILLVAGLLFWLRLETEARALRLTVNCHDFVETIEMTGVVEAARFEEVRSPEAPYDRQVTWLVEEGTFVRKGDLIAQFDVADAELHLESDQERVKRTQYSQDAEKANWNIQLYDEAIKKAKEEERKALALLQYEGNKYQPDLPREIGTVQKDKQEHLVESARRRIAQIEHQRDVEIRRRDGWIAYLKRQVDVVRQRIEQYQVRAPMDSIVVYPLIPVNGIIKKVETGDRLGRLQPFAKLPDLTSLVIKLGIEEYRMQKVKENSEVRFRTRAYPNREFVGRVISISRLASNDLFRDGRRLFEVAATITDAGAADLKVGMVVEASLLIQRHPNVYAFPREYLRHDKNGEWIEAEDREGKKVRLTLDHAIQTEDFFLLPKESFGGGPLIGVYYPAEKSSAP